MLIKRGGPANMFLTVVLTIWQAAYKLLFIICTVLPGNVEKTTLQNQFLQQLKYITVNSVKNFWDKTTFSWPTNSKLFYLEWTSLRSSGTILTHRAQLHNRQRSIPASVLSLIPSSLFSHHITAGDGPVAAPFWHGKLWASESWFIIYLRLVSHQYHLHYRNQQQELPSLYSLSGSSTASCQIGLLVTCPSYPSNYLQYSSPFILWLHLLATMHCLSIAIVLAIRCPAHFHQRPSLSEGLGIRCS